MWKLLLPKTLHNYKWGKWVVMEELVSIIMPNYNGAKYLKESIESVLAQTYTNWELLIVDDCSTDDSVKIIEEYVQQDERVHLIVQKENKGVANTRNTGIANAKGKYIALLDSDDVWKSEKLEKQKTLMEKETALISYCSYDFIDECGKKIKKTFKVPPKTNFKKMLISSVISCSTGMFEAQLLKDHYFNDKYYHEDYVLWLELLKIPVKAVGVQEVLANYRLHSDSRSAQKINAAKERWKIYREVLRLSFFRSCFSFVGYSIRGVIKYYF